MKQRKIISRKDHEIYFFPVPPAKHPAVTIGLRSRMTRKYVLDILNEQHPGFSANSHVDIKLIIIDKKRWFMATVISNEILAEYKIMYRNALFFTNTSILAYEKSFSFNSPVKVDDELIGFDSEKKIPVSIPLETEGVTNDQNLSSKLKNVPLKCSVFKNSDGRIFKDLINRRIIAAILIGLSAFVIYFTKFSYPNMIKKEFTGILTEYYTEQSDEIIYLPSAVSILTDISEMFLADNGEIERWFYNEGDNVKIIIQSSNISALTAYNIFSQLEYLTLHDIQNINYSDNRPQLAIELNNKKNNYSLPVPCMFENNNNMFTRISELIESFRNSNIVILNEVLPSAVNKYQSYMIYFSADDKGFIDSMKILEDYCGKYSIRIKELEILFESEKKIFLISCFLYQADIQDGMIIKLDGEKESIPLAFGYKPAKIERINDKKEETYMIVSAPQEMSELKQVIGSITDFDGKKIYFYGSEGKISIRSEL